ncbi:hypothetical protein [Micromonospora sp. NPDC047730]|uniref:hypothetical protein n=1 Tax=Micromonospora sp. NPDC047730 TaxID=3364253 RepID=UPI00371DF46A
MSTEAPRDWRGTPITPGALVVYAYTSGSSALTAEATVAPAPFVTPSGAIRLDLVRRSSGHGSYRDRVAVSPAGLTVVETLPPTDLPTAAEVREQLEKGRLEREAIKATHDLPSGYWTGREKCARCGMDWRETLSRRCGE